MKKLFIVLAVLSATATYAKQPAFIDQLSHVLQAHTAKAPPTELIESAFSPDSGSEELVLKVINASEHSVRVAAYSFTSPPVVKALLSAKKRGVDVRVVVDDSRRSRAFVRHI